MAEGAADGDAEVYSRVVITLLYGVDGLAGNAYGVGQLLLGHIHCRPGCLHAEILHYFIPPLIFLVRLHCPAPFYDNIYGVYYVDNYQKGSGKEVDPAYGKPSLFHVITYPPLCQVYFTKQFKYLTFRQIQATL